MDNLRKGRFGELLAAKFLEKKGYRLISQNWTCHWGEIDLVFREEKILVFVEVKYRSSLRYGYGQDSFTWKKRKSLFRAISNYLLRNRVDMPWRCDVVSILQEGRKISIKHYKSVAS